MGFDLIGAPMGVHDEAFNARFDERGELPVHQAFAGDF